MMPMFRKVAVWFALALLAWVGVVAAVAGPEEALRQNLAGGKPTVLVVARTSTAAERKSEAYADWAAYLNDFSQEHRGEFQFLTVKPGEVKTIFAASTPIKQPYAMVFFRNEREALLHDGMIHDRIVYLAAQVFLRGKDPAAEAGAEALTPFSFRLRGR